MDLLDKLEALLRAQRAPGCTANEVLAQMGTPSTSIAVLDSGFISARTFSTIGDDAETVFQAGSISKPIAGLAIMKMIQSGALCLDAPITKYLSDASLELISTPTTRSLVGHITIRHLMSHTSGLNLHGFAGYTTEAPNLQSILSGAPPANNCHVHLSGLPGHEYDYSGGGFTVLQLIMEEVSRKPFPEVVSELVLEPLGMRRSFYTLQKGENHASAHMNGYTPSDSSYHTFPEQAAAGLWTTPSDLLRAVRAVQQSLKTCDGPGFLPEDLAREMLTEVSSSMALSWLAPMDPGTVFGHFGYNDPGFFSVLLGYADLNDNGSLPIPSRNSGVCVMTNSAAGGFVCRKLLCAIAYLKNWADVSELRGLEYIIPLYLPEQADSKWRGWKGTWGSHWTIDEQHGSPVLSFQHLPATRLLPAAHTQTTSEAEFSIDLVVEGLEIMLRLTKEGEEKIVHLWHGSKFKKLSSTSNGQRLRILLSLDSDIRQ